MNSNVRNNWSSFIKGLATFIIINLLYFIQNVMENIVKLDVYWCSAKININFFKNDGYEKNQ
jgi:hypothetical protein